LCHISALCLRQLVRRQDQSWKCVTHGEKVDIARHQHVSVTGLGPFLVFDAQTAGDL